MCTNFAHKQVQAKLNANSTNKNIVIDVYINQVTAKEKCV